MAASSSEAEILLSRSSDDDVSAEVRARMEETPVASGAQGPVNREQRDPETPNPFKEVIFGYA